MKFNNESNIKSGIDLENNRMNDFLNAVFFESLNAYIFLHIDSFHKYLFHKLIQLCLQSIVL